MFVSIMSPPLDFTFHVSSIVLSAFIHLTIPGTQDTTININKKVLLGFPGGAVVENLPANAGDMGSSPGLVRSHMPRSN